MKPTKEQQRVIDFAVSDRAKNLKVLAYAGAGKTSTLAAAARAAREKEILYTAFGREVIDTAKLRLGGDALCDTVHALARRGLSASTEYSEKIRIFHAGFGGSGWRVEKYYQAALVHGLHHMRKSEAEWFTTAALKLVTAFCHSGAPEISADVMSPDFMDDSVAEAIGQDRELVEELARRAWELVVEGGERYPLTYDYYLKLWQLTSAADDLSRHGLILFDEAQDASDVMLAAVAASGVRAIYVGDQHQQIYRFRGSVNAFDKVENAAACELTLTHRFGSEIAAVCGEILSKKGLAVTINTLPDAERRGAGNQSDAVLCRSNVAVISTALDAWKEGRPVTILASVLQNPDQLLDLCHLALGERGKIKNRFIAGLKSIDDAKNVFDRQGRHDELRLADLAAQRAAEIPRMLGALRGGRDLPGKAGAPHLTVATAHQAKGLEWGSVTLHDDFHDALKQVEKNGERIRVRIALIAGKDDPAQADDAVARVGNDEVNLLYVAASRAVNRLSYSPRLGDWLGKVTTPAAGLVHSEEAGGAREGAGEGGHAPEARVSVHEVGRTITLEQALDRMFRI